MLPVELWEDKRERDSLNLICVLFVHIVFSNSHEIVRTNISCFFFRELLLKWLYCSCTIRYGNIGNIIGFSLYCRSKYLL